MIRKIYFNYNKLLEHFSEFSDNLFCVLIEKYGIRIYVQENTVVKVCRIDFFCEEMLKLFIIENKQLYRQQIFTFFLLEVLRLGSNE